MKKEEKEKMIRNTMIYQRYEFSRRLCIFFGKCLKELHFRGPAQVCFVRARLIKRWQVGMIKDMLNIGQIGFTCEQVRQGMLEWNKYGIRGYSSKK